MKKVSRLLKMCFVGIFLFVLCSCTTGIPATPSDAESKLTEKGYDVEVHKDNNAAIGAAFMLQILGDEMIEEVILKNVTDVVFGQIVSNNDDNHKAVCAIWFKSSEVAKQVYESFCEQSEKEDEGHKMEDFIYKIYENIMYMGNEKGLQDFEN